MPEDFEVPASQGSGKFVLRPLPPDVDAREPAE